MDDAADCADRWRPTSPIWGSSGLLSQDIVAARHNSSPPLTLHRLDGCDNGTQGGLDQFDVARSGANERTL